MENQAEKDFKDLSINELLTVFSNFIKTNNLPPRIGWKNNLVWNYLS